MRGRAIDNKWNRAQAYNDYRANKMFNIDQLKKIADDENDEINGEWFGDGLWQINDALSEVEEEDWEIWYDWFPND